MFSIKFDLPSCYSSSTLNFPSSSKGTWQIYAEKSSYSDSYEMKIYYGNSNVYTGNMTVTIAFYNANFEMVYGTTLNTRQQCHERSVETKTLVNAGLEQNGRFSVIVRFQPPVSVNVDSPVRDNYFQRMFEEEIFADVTINAVGGDFKAQRTILSRSPVFEKMLNNETWREAKEGKLIVDIKKEVLYELVRYLYCDEIPEVAQFGLDLLYAADKYDIPGLKQSSIAYLVNNINLQNFADCLIAADQLNISSLKNAVFNCIRLNKQKIASSEGWMLLKENPELILEVSEKLLEN